MKRAVAVLILLILLVSAWAYVSPRLAAKRFRDAVTAGDTRALRAVVDFSALRRNLKADLRSLATQRASHSTTNPLLSALGAEVGGAMSDAAVEQLVSPRGIIRLARYGSSQSGASAARLLDMGYRGISEFGVTMGNARGEGVVTFLFHRSGLTWRLARLEIPSLTAR